MDRHTRHRNCIAGRFAARRQRDVDQFGSASGIVIKQLVEITHPVKQQQVGMLRLDVQILAHHRGVFFADGRAHGLASLGGVV